jgi:catechol 2,3-dioxygenase-like lactoylglutathione lyase family enzyme
MDNTISELVTAYDTRAITRRQLVAALAALAPAAKLAAQPLPGGTLDHVSLLVGNLETSTGFYRDVLGLTAAQGVRPDGSVRLNLSNGGYLTLREANPAGTVDHFCIRLAGFNKELVTQQLSGHGLVPVDEANFTGTGAGFHVVDPDGLKVQLT